MKQTCALLLSLVLLMAQFALATPACATETMPTARTAGHSCCAPAQPVKVACNAPCCVTSPSGPRDTTAPGAPVSASARSLHFVAALLVALWTLPAPADLPASLSASSTDVASAPPVPLFLRHGALLI